LAREAGELEEVPALRFIDEVAGAGAPDDGNGEASPAEETAGS
jgi:hypothetical protein